MERLKTYVINLPSSEVRRKFMSELLSEYNIFDVEFIEGVDGRRLSDKERREKFDYERCLQLIGRQPNEGEVGCALSHRKCYEALLTSKCDYAVIFEDDISFMRNPEELSDLDIDSLMRTDIPRVIMLSGDYWFWARKKIVSVYDCNGAYAYIINRAAAKLLLSHRACCVADQWRLFKAYGVDIKAVYPYMTDANLKMDILSSDVRQNAWSINRKRMAFSAVIRSYVDAVVRRGFKYFGHFESKIPVIYNKPIVK